MLDLRARDRKAARKSRHGNRHRSARRHAILGRRREHQAHQHHESGLLIGEWHQGRAEVDRRPARKIRIDGGANEGLVERRFVDQREADLALGANARERRKHPAPALALLRPQFLGRYQPQRQPSVCAPRRLEIAGKSHDAQHGRASAGAAHAGPGAQRLVAIDGEPRERVARVVAGVEIERHPCHHHAAAVTRDEVEQSATLEEIGQAGREQPHRLGHLRMRRDRRDPLRLRRRRLGDPEGAHAVSKSRLRGQESSYLVVNAGN